MKSVMLGVVACVMVVGMTACSSLPGFLGGSKNQIEAILATAAAGMYEVVFTKDNKVIYTEKWNCTQADGKLTGCHKVAASPVVPVPVIP